MGVIIIGNLYSGSKYMGRGEKGTIYGTVICSQMKDNTRSENNI